MAEPGPEENLVRALQASVARLSEAIKLLDNAETSAIIREIGSLWARANDSKRETASQLIPMLRKAVARPGVTGERYRISVNWRARFESPADCAAHTIRMLDALSNAHPVMAQWHRWADTYEESRKPLYKRPPPLADITKLFEANRFADDVPAKGFAVHGWNGHDNPNRVRLRLLLGASVPLGSGYRRRPIFLNSADLTLNPDDYGGTVLATITFVRAALLALVGAWEPDIGYVIPWSDGSLSKKPAKEKRIPAAWITYLSRSYAERISPEPSISSERTPDGGLLLISTAATYDKDEPAHAAAADAIQEALAPLEATLA